MAFAVELEEWVGAHWHRFITRHASGEFEAARVTLESMRRPLGMLFQALGDRGSPSRRPALLRRTWLRVAGVQGSRWPVQRRQPAPAGIPRGLSAGRPNQ